MTSKLTFPVAGLVLVVLCAAIVLLTWSEANAKDPRLTRPFYVDPTSSAAQAFKAGEPVKRLAKTPQAIWLTESSAPRSAAKSIVKQHVAAAKKKKRTVVFVAYAIPGRDCGSYSGGGLSAAAYPKWIAAIAAGLKGSKAMVVLEPDAVATLGDCPGQGNRQALLKRAAKKLTKAGAWVYLDGGHSQWQQPSVMADRLVASGAAHARGFATNVSNHRRTADEKSYANALLRELSARGVKKRRYVIDVSRNGVGPSVNNVWCNNREARVGTSPRVVNKASLDALLWIKRPGESDGYCNGGPVAGAWWGDAARGLLGSR